MSMHCNVYEQCRLKFRFKYWFKSGLKHWFKSGLERRLKSGFE
jgi:hypothetical protein